MYELWVCFIYLIQVAQRDYAHIVFPSVSDQGYELLHSLHTPDGIPMDEDAKHVHFHDFSDVS